MGRGQIDISTTMGVQMISTVAKMRPQAHREYVLEQIDALGIHGRFSKQYDRDGPSDRGEQREKLSRCHHLAAPGLLSSSNQPQC